MTLDQAAVDFTNRYEKEINQFPFTVVGAAFREGHAHALKSAEVLGLADAIAYVLQYDQNSPERKRLSEALAGFHKVQGGG